MRLLLALFVLGVALATTVLADQTPKTKKERIEDLKHTIKVLGKQVMLQQFYAEEKARTTGNSGLKVTRVGKGGTQNYHSPATVGQRYCAVHDHTNNYRTAGMGELLIVMNGVEFRTRHNDYKINMPSRNSSLWHLSENVPFPDVPPAVLAKPTVDEQVKEMWEYYRAFKHQNITHRDYRPYFKANLCYIEGAWTIPESAGIEEPFESDRHSIDADSWAELMDKIRYTSYNGGKSVLENFAFLPQTLYNITDDGVPLYAQWNYRIKCHPVKEDLPFKYIKTQNDLAYRLPQRASLNMVRSRRAGRFVLNEQDDEHFNRGSDSLLDRIMSEIPGKDNYPAKIFDNTKNRMLYDMRHTNGTQLNTGYYHRYYKIAVGALGAKTASRGFSDANLFVAENTQAKVPPMNLRVCDRDDNCQEWTTRVSYALPLEIVYMTPIHRWNPYNVPENVHKNTIRRGGRNGGKTVATAYNGTNTRLLYYKTPSHFYSSSKGEDDPADTARKGVGILDRDNQVRLMAASGLKIVTNAVGGGVGKIRTRYPIMPINGEGLAVWKELNALKDMTMNINKYSPLFLEAPFVNDSSEAPGTQTYYEMTTTYQTPPGEHTHNFFLDDKQLDELNNGKNIEVSSSTEIGHTHELQLTMGQNNPEIVLCDGNKACWDGHSKFVKEVE